jgi:hypothetical protein
MTMMTATSSSFKKQSILIIIIALSIHGGLGIVLFLLEPLHDSLYSQEAQVILINKQTPTTSQQQRNERKPKNSTSLATTPPAEWGEMLGRKNNFGLPDSEVALNTTNHIPTAPPQDSSQSSPQQTSDHPESLEKIAPPSDLKKNRPLSDATQQTTPPISEELSALDLLPKKTARPEKLVDNEYAAPTDTTTLVRDVTPNQEPSISSLEPLQSSAIEQNNSSQKTTLKTTLKNSRQTPNSNQTDDTPSLDTPSKHKPSELTLAAIGRGFIEQSKYDGTHNVTMLGKKGGAISAEQLKIERYVERLSWCLQNSFKLLRNTIDPHISGEAEVQVYLQLDRSGTIQELKLLSGSGSSILDQHTLAVFKDAGTSFPPVPTYIKASPFAISFHVDYGITQNSAPLSFSFKH